MLQEQFSVSSDKSKIELDVVHGFLTKAYWSIGIPRETVERAIRHSLCFGIYDKDNKQVGFARVVTDYAVFAYLADVFVLEEYRGRGLSKLLMETIMAHPDLQNLRRWSLATKDAHDLYEKFGFTGLKSPERMMEIVRPNIYTEIKSPNQLPN